MSGIAVEKITSEVRESLSDLSTRYPAAKITVTIEVPTKVTFEISGKETDPETKVIFSDKAVNGVTSRSKRTRRFWHHNEIAIVKEHINGSPEEISKALKREGYNRHKESIRSKQLRIKDEFKLLGVTNC